MIPNWMLAQVRCLGSELEATLQRHFQNANHSIYGKFQILRAHVSPGLDYVAFLMNHRAIFFRHPDCLPAVGRRLGLTTGLLETPAGVWFVIELAPHHQAEVMEGVT